jgi:hypothetical protein
MASRTRIGCGAVAEAIDAATKRLIVFAMRLGPFAAAQLRIYAEVLRLSGKTPQTPPRMYLPADRQRIVPLAAPRADSASLHLVAASGFAHQIPPA